MKLLQRKISSMRPFNLTTQRNVNLQQQNRLATKELVKQFVSFHIFHFSWNVFHSEVDNSYWAVGAFVSK